MYLPTSSCHRTVRARVAALALVAAVILTPAASAEAVVPDPTLGTAATYSALAGQTVTNTGPSVLSGSAGVSPGSAVTGFPPGLVLAPGRIDRATPVAAQAEADARIAYNDLDGRTPPERVPDDLVGQTILPGLYTAAGPLSLTGSVTLDAGGNPAAVFIFQSSSSLVVGSGSQVLLTNGAQACHVYWQVDSEATIGTNSNFAGTVLALQSISLATGATLRGRALALDGAVTLDSNVIDAGACSDAPGTGGSSAPSSTPPTTATPTTTATTALPPPTTTASTGPTTPGPTITGPTGTEPTATGSSGTTGTGTTVAPPMGTTGPSSATITIGTTTPGILTTATTTTGDGGGATGSRTTYVVDTPQVPITPVGGVNTGGGDSTSADRSVLGTSGALALLVAAALVFTTLRRSRRG